MGSSSKKKKEKQKDFQKAKLKVGKAKVKPANFTDTSFRSKAIVLNQQSLSITAPSSSTQFTHHLSMLSSKSEAQRRESLAHLTTSIASRPIDSPLPQPFSIMLPSLVPLLLDGSNSVRTQLLKFLRTLPKPEIEDHAAQLLPYIRAGMTHLAADIRISAVEALSWLVDVAGGELVSCAGGWIKTLNCFLSLLGWHTEESSKFGVNRSSFSKLGGTNGGRPMVKALQTLAEFLHTGIGTEASTEHKGRGGGGGKKNQDGGEEQVDVFLSSGWIFPLDKAPQHMIPSRANPYAYLNLFGQPRDAEGDMYDTQEDRYRVFSGSFAAAIERGVENARKEGGEVGRASAAVSKVLREARTYSSSLLVT